MPGTRNSDERCFSRRVALQMAVFGLPSLLFGASWASRSAGWDFQQIIRLAEQRYGSLGDARKRILDWQALLLQSQGLGEMDKLQAVNRHFNRVLRFVDDIKIWGEHDYWATPVEALIKGRADCEDYSLAKYFSLRQLAVPADKLRITYVKALRLNQAHMVVTYYANSSAEPLVLDNLINQILPANQRSDLLPVYAFNAEGLYLFKTSGVKRTGDTKQLSRWQDVLRKMRIEGFS